MKKKKPNFTEILEIQQSRTKIFSLYEDLRFLINQSKIDSKNEPSFLNELFNEKIIKEKINSIKEDSVSCYFFLELLNDYYFIQKSKNIVNFLKDKIINQENFDFILKNIIKKNEKIENFYNFFNFEIQNKINLLNFLFENKKFLNNENIADYEQVVYKSMAYIYNIQKQLGFDNLKNIESHVNLQNQDINFYFQKFIILNCSYFLDEFKGFKNCITKIEKENISLLKNKDNINFYTLCSISEGALLSIGEFNTTNSLNKIKEQYDFFSSIHNIKINDDIKNYLEKSCSYLFDYSKNLFEFSLMKTIDDIGEIIDQKFLDLFLKNYKTQTINYILLFNFKEMINSKILDKNDFDKKIRKINIINDIFLDDLTTKNNILKTCLEKMADSSNDKTLVFIEKELLKLNLTSIDIKNNKKESFKL